MTKLQPRKNTCKYLPTIQNLAEYKTVHRFITRHSRSELARYLFYCMFFCLYSQRFLDNRGPIHAKVRMQAYSANQRYVLIQWNAFIIVI